MQYNSDPNGLDLYSDGRYQCGLDETSDTTSYPIKAFTRNANKAVDRATYLILKANGWNMPYDDSNNTGELLDTSNNLVSGIQKTALGASWLKISRVRIKDSAGNWRVLPELPRRAQNNAQLAATSGDPFSYFVLGNYMYFDKAPNYSSTAGIEVQYQRAGSYFAYTDTTKTPGWASVFHTYVSAFSAREFCKVNGLADRVAQLNLDIGSPPDLENGQAGYGMEKEMMDFYSEKDMDMKPALTPQREDYGTIGLDAGSGSWPDATSLNPRGF